MHITRIMFSNVLLSLVLGFCFMSIQAQEPVATSTLLNYETVEATETALSPIDPIKSTIAVTTENIPTEHATEPDFLTNPAIDDQMSTKLEESTAEATVQLSTGVEQTSPKFETTVSETTTAPEEPTTMPLETSTTTTVAESITSEFLPITSLQETTGDHTSPTADLTTSVHHQHKTTVAMTSALTEAPNPTPISSEQPAGWTEAPSSTSEVVDTTFPDVTTTTSATTVILTSQLVNHIPELHHSTPGDDSVSTHFTASTNGGNVRQSVLPIQTNWLLIVIVCVAVVCVLCVGMLLIVHQRKKNTSGKFGPGYMNGQSKKSKKKKGAENDTWAGPVNLEAGEKADCDEEAQEALMPGGNRDGEDTVLSTFATLEAGETPNGGVGGEGSKEAKKWEEQEPLMYIDEDVKDDDVGETAAESERQKVNENQEKVATDEMILDGGETFCLTTAV